MNRVHQVHTKLIRLPLHALLAPRDISKDQVELPLAALVQQAHIHLPMDLQAVLAVILAFINLVAHLLVVIVAHLVLLQTLAVLLLALFALLVHIRQVQIVLRALVVPLVHSQVKRILHLVRLVVPELFRRQQDPLDVTLV